MAFLLGSKLDVATTSLLAIKEVLEPTHLTCDIWWWSILALRTVAKSRDVAYPPHMLSINEIRKVKNAKNNLEWEVTNGYCDDTKSDCDFEIECGFLCSLFRVVMRGY